MRVAHALLKARGSSARWLERQTHDPYVKQRVDGGEAYRSRSAFKLVSLAAKYPDILAPGKSVVDLGAAPGGWTQVAASRVKGAPVIAVDLLRMMPVPGAHSLQADFLQPETQRYITERVGGEMQVDTVLSDMMSAMSGVRTRDVQASLDLVGAATDFAKATLKVGRGMGEAVAGKKRYDGGCLVMKFFAHPDLDDFRRAELDGWFAKVVVDKPKESRNESSEAYFFKQLMPFKLHLERHAGRGELPSRHATQGPSLEAISSAPPAPALQLQPAPRVGSRSSAPSTSKRMRRDARSELASAANIEKDHKDERRQAKRRQKDAAKPAAQPKGRDSRQLCAGDSSDRVIDLCTPPPTPGALLLPASVHSPSAVKGQYVDVGTQTDTAEMDAQAARRIAAATKALIGEMQYFT